MPRVITPMKRFSSIPATTLLLVAGVGCPAPQNTPPVNPPLTTLPREDIVELTAGGRHACARYDTGMVACWGANDQGQLGDGSSEERTSATPVRAIRDARQVVAGLDHTCVVRSTGDVLCWGNNATGQLGTGRIGAFERQPRPVASLVGAVALVAGNGHTCALLSDRNVSCWGDGIASPTLMSLVRDVVEIGAGGNRVCARRSSGPVACWSVSANPTPRDVPGTDGAEQLFVGPTHNCVLVNGRAQCWGSDADGQITGRGGPTIAQPRPIPLSAVKELALGEGHTCARTEQGQVQCWGLRDGGRLGDGRIEGGRSGPTAVAGLGDATTIVAGAAFTCASKRQGGVVCWGSNVGSALGSGRPGPTDSGAFASPTGVTEAREVAAGDGFACALSQSGNVQCWGRNDDGQLGRPAAPNGGPMPVPGLNGITALSAGEKHVCAVSRNGGVVCWGGNTFSQAAVTGTPRVPPTPYPGVNDAIDVAAGNAHTCVVRRNGLVSCWGSNEFGQLGAKPGAVIRGPSQVSAITDVTQLDAGGAHSCAVTNAGRIMCWGQNEHGQLGNGASALDLKTPRATPVAVHGMADAVQVVTAEAHSCARRRNGQVACWGENGLGQLGGNTSSNWTTRIPVKGIASATDLAAGRNHVCAQITGGQVQCWGDNSAGQLGSTAPELSRIPITVPELRDASGSIAAGFSHTCVVRTTGTLACWGSPDAGALGDISFRFSERPIPVVGLE